jgi:hypothetical protein
MMNHSGPLPLPDRYNFLSAHRTPCWRQWPLHLLYLPSSSWMVRERQVELCA